MEAASMNLFFEFSALLGSAQHCQPVAVGSLCCAWAEMLPAELRGGWLFPALISSPRCEQVLQEH